MRVQLAALVSGLIFGVGLTISRMIDPSKIIGFLDVTGAWDPSLALVMIGALAVTLPAFAIARRHETTLFQSKLQLPTRNDIDPPLVIGAILFGIGWGIGGFCPGPALSALAFGLIKPMVFVAAMIVGMVGVQVLSKNPD